ncbi:hypothetical protein EYF80_020569 [Liparis tanakae]|uniref:Uncharacterized protein n=1 Tax=Liparis tanakae TaxID=230148 RepID=A0A4Z2HWI8_9TELE|nr:hypothetical protein EYF80_020569 [Liparis tanakae]
MTNCLDLERTTASNHALFCDPLAALKHTQVISEPPPGKKNTHFPQPLRLDMFSQIERSIRFLMRTGGGEGRVAAAAKAAVMPRSSRDPRTQAGPI